MIRFCQWFAWIFAVICHDIAYPIETPAGHGQLENAPKLIPGGTDEKGRKYSYLGQAATHQKLILTASNGFFNPGVATAKGESNLPKVGDEELIVPNFAYLEWKKTDDSLRWHILVKQPGSVNFKVYMDVADPGSKVDISFAGQTQSVTTSKSGNDKPQPWDLIFTVDKPGEYTVSLTATDLAGSRNVGNLYRIDAFGPAMEGANLLRVRWRPAAVHGGYASSSESNLLVFTTRSMVSIGNYSPITTPFGYYGTSFDDQRKSSGGFNFSMWGKKDAATDLEMMPHLLGVGSPVGEFSGFGHEGSGVKPRGWEPMPDHPELVIQALRVENGEKYDTYFGYYFDHPTDTWKYFASGRKWHGGKPVTHLRLGSFCEVPGPPQNQRTGDVYREVRRRGWLWSNNVWKPIEEYKPGGNGSKGEIPVNKSWYTSDNGEYAMGCGGIRLYEHDSSLVKPSPKGPLPPFLTSPSVENLFTTPIIYHQVQATEIGPNRALIELNIASSDDLIDGTLNYGTKNSLTFAPRELHGTEKGSELSKAINAQAWEFSKEIKNPNEGIISVSIEDLKPETTYFYRVLLNNQVSRVWNNETRQFTTPQAGGSPIKKSPLKSTGKQQSRSPGTPKVISGEPFRIWTYTVNGISRKVEGKLTGIAGKKIQIERKADGRKGTIDLKLLSAEDREYVEKR